MCVIAYKTRGATLSDSMIRQMFRTNPDGAGFMYAEGGAVRFEKGFFSVEALLKRFRSCVSEDMPAVLHCRIATHGATCPQLCHPFPVVRRHAKEFKQAGSASLCLAHNGVIPFGAWAWYAQGGDSDTSAYVHRLALEGLQALPDERQAERMAGEVGGSRLAFMDGRGEVLLLGKWEKIDGVWFSNLHHLNRR